MSSTKTHRPPRLAEKLLSWFVKDDLLDEILGDLYEYHSELADKPRWKQWLFYWFHVLNFLRPWALKRILRSNSNYTVMFKHSLLISFRNFKRYKSSFFINLVGLSTALTCVTLIYLWVSDELAMDKFHEKGDNIFHVMEAMEFPSGTVVGGNTSGVVAQLMRDELPEVESAVQVAKHLDGATLSLADKAIHADGYYVSKGFFEMFSFPIVAGNKSKLWDNPKAIVLSESTAISLFGSTAQVMGQTVDLQHEKPYVVSGIVQDVPGNSSEHFDFLLSFEGHTDEQAYLLAWTSQSIEVYLELAPGTDVVAFNEKIHKFIGEHSEGREYRVPFVVKYADEYLHGEYDGGVQSGGRITYVRSFILIAVFILGIACINFMNLATARASRRLKEIGIKKVVGARRPALALQFLTEAVFIAFIGLALAIVFVAALLPQFNELTGKRLSLSLEPQFVSALLGITVVTGVLSGSYPALYLSGFTPISILKGKLKASMAELWTRKGLVVLQYTVSVILIVAVVVVYRQLDFIQSKNLGYSKEQIVHFSLEGKMKNEETLSTFLRQVRDLPGVTKASATRSKLTGDGWGVGGLFWEGSEEKDAIYFEHMIAYYDLLETLDIELAEGRAFSRDYTTENDKVMFNEAAIAHMGLKDPVGQTITFWGQKKEIIGVVKDFHFDSFHEKVKPMLISFWPDRLAEFMVKIEAGREKETLAQLEDLYLDFNPGFLFDYQFLDNDFQELYESEKRVSALSNYFAGVAVLISCLGLFGLAAFTAERRIKEIGIRKILGASTVGVVQMLSGDFIKMVVVAIVIALPVSYMVAKEWLDSFVYRIDLEWWVFAAAGFITLVIAWLAIGWQTVKAAQQSPVKNLRYE